MQINAQHGEKCVSVVHMDRYNWISFHGLINTNASVAIANRWTTPQTSLDSKEERSLPPPVGVPKKSTPQIPEPTIAEMKTRIGTNQTAIESMGQALQLKLGVLKLDEKWLEKHGATRKREGVSAKISA